MATGKSGASVRIGLFNVIEHSVLEPPQPDAADFSAVVDSGFGYSYAGYCLMIDAGQALAGRFRFVRLG